MMQLKGWLRPLISFHFKWYDFWVGAYYDRENRVLYVCPLPMVVIRIERRREVVDPFGAWADMPDEFWNTWEEAIEESRHPRLKEVERLTAEVEALKAENEQLKNYAKWAQAWLKPFADVWDNEADAAYDDM